MVKKVLVVDDEDDIVSFLERFMKRFGIASIKALSGEDALRLYNKDDISFVFLDINMNGMDGLTVLEELRKLNPEVKAIIITGNTKNQLHEKAIQLGAIDYITKPLDLNDLKKKIDKYILCI